MLHLRARNRVKREPLGVQINWTNALKRAAATRPGYFQTNPVMALIRCVNGAFHQGFNLLLRAFGILRPREKHEHVIQSHA